MKEMRKYAQNAEKAGNPDITRNNNDVTVKLCILKKKHLKSKRSPKKQDY